MYRKVQIIKHLFGAMQLSSEACISVKPSKRIQRFREELNKYSNGSILTDSFGRYHTYLRISVTERCNLRCMYCMPAEGVKLTNRDGILTTDEIIQIANLFVKEGVRKVRLTGGEPTVRKDIVDIIARLKGLHGIEQVAITTNGLTLTRQLPALQRAGLDALNISLDTLKEERFERFTRRKGWGRVMAAIDLAVQLGYNPVKVNCVVMESFNDDELIDFVNMTRTRPIDVRFIEYMPFQGNNWNESKMVTFADMKKIILETYPDFHVLPNDFNDTSKAYQVPGFVGKVGFITSMSEHFCDSCNRLRITADGNLKVCLFEGKGEVSLRDAIRGGASEETLKSLIGQAVHKKKKQHAGMSNLMQMENRPMILIVVRKEPLKKRKYGLERTTRVYNSNLLPFPKISDSLYFNVRCTLRRMYSSLSHLDDDGKARMVDVGWKNESKRVARAKATIEVGPVISKLIADCNVKKGDVLSVAQLAGIMAAKRTSDLIPLCHPLALSYVHVKLQLNECTHSIDITSEVACTGKTGVEMEALTAVSVAALTVYDMCKSAAYPHTMKITNIFLVSKTGGTKGNFNMGEEQVVRQVR